MPVSPENPKAGLPEDLAHLDVVVVHDPIRTKNGGIDVVANIARFLDAPVYTLHQTESPTALDDIEVREITADEPLIWRAFHRAGLGRLLEFPKMIAYQNWEPPRSADVVVTTGTRSQFLIHHPEQHRIQYFNTPARWLWDLSHEQWDGHNRLIEWLLVRYASFLRTMDVTSVHRFDRVLANSDLVARRIKTYYDRDSTVAYCPIDTFAIEGGKSEGYFMMLNRLVPEKRVKLVVKVFSELEIPLKVAGVSGENTADYAADCRRIAGDNVEFLGWVDGNEKNELLAGAEALVFAGEHEDFGMPPVEAMAAGKPVVGVNEGFTKYQINDGETGTLFEPDVESLCEAVKQCIEIKWDCDKIQETSRQYDTRAVREVWIETLRELSDAND